MGLTQNASQAEIRKNYLKMAIRLHPDKNLHDADAHLNFQALQKAYTILGDPEKRKVYDSTGDLEAADSLTGEQFDSLYKYYREVYAKVSENDIAAFEESYRGSEEESNDLLAHYTKFRGNMNKVFSWQMCSYPELDSHRFSDILQEAIQNRSVTHYASFTKWADAVGKKPRPKNPLKTLARHKKRKGGKNEDMALIAAIQQRQPSNYSKMLSTLGAKYGVAQDEEDISEEEFKAARKKLETRKR